jgi:hypothetical protein
MTFACHHCDSSFDNRALYDRHRKKCVKTAIFTTYTGQEVTITHNNDGRFLCYCSSIKCPKASGFATVDALQKHMKNSKTIWLGPEKKVDFLY